MAPIAGKPFLEILLASLARKGFDRVILSLGFMGEKISGYFGSQFGGMELVYVQEDSPLGTGGAIRLAMTHCESDHVFVFNGDTFVDLEADLVEQVWQKDQRPIIVGREVLDTTRYGRLLVMDGTVKGFSEKGMAGPGLINAGCYVFPKGQLDSWPVNTPFSLETDYLVSAVTQEPVNVFQTAGLFIDIGIPEDFSLAQTLLADYV